MVQERYGASNAPNTHKRGSQPIDGIFASESIEMLKGGYDGGQDSISDHRLIWADITLDSILGANRGEISQPKSKRLQLTNRRSTKRFNRLFRQQIRKHNLGPRARALKNEIGDAWTLTEAQAKEYNAIYEQRNRAFQYAEKRCMKFPANDFPFSMKLKQSMGKASICQGMKKKLMQGKRIHNQWIIREKKRFGITDHINKPLTTPIH